jgi:hypothetical protein
MDPLAEPEAAGDGPPFDLESMAGPARRRGKGRPGLPRWVTLGTWALLVGSVAVTSVVVFRMLGDRFTTKKADTVDWVPEDARFNFRLTVRRGEWKENSAARLGLEAFFALEKINAARWLAIAAEDFGIQNPRDADLEKGAVQRLERYFTGSGLEWEPRPAKTRLAGRPVQRIVFQGEHDKVMSRGECLMIRHRGIGYWIFLWAPAKQNQKWQTTRRELADLQASPGGGFTLLGSRKGWEERPRAMDRFQGAKHRFSLLGLKDYWEQFSATDEDPNGDLYLQRKNAKARREPVRGVTILVVVVPANPGATWQTALQDAKDHLLRRQPAGEEKPRLKLAPGQADELGVEKDVGNVPGRVGELKVLNGSLQNLAVIAVVMRAEHVYIIQCQCPWKDRASWRGEFNQMLATFDLRDE